MAASIVGSNDFFQTPEISSGVGYADPPAENLYDVLRAQAERHPDAAAILAPGRAPRSYAGLLDRLDSIRTFLNGYGLGRGDRVAILAGRGADTAEIVLGITSCAVCIPLNAASPLVELEQSFIQTRAAALLLAATVTTEVKELARRLGILLLEPCPNQSVPAADAFLQGGRRSVARGDGRVSADDIAFILRTSGTTGRAKIVPTTHRNVVARIGKSRGMLDLNPSDRCLNLMPLCYNHGLNSALISALGAGCAVICPPAFDEETFFTCMRDFLPTWYTGSFTFHQFILEWLERQPHALTGHRLRFVRSASGPLPERVRTRTEAILGVPMLQAYGATETGTIAANRPIGKRKPGTVGYSPDNDFAIMDANGNLAPRGEGGEVVVRGATVFGGYENDPSENQRVFRAGWYHTGDQGVVDADGFLKLLGRIDEVINRGGQKIAPREIDEALLQHSAVSQAVSFPILHATLHQDVAAAVVLHSGAQATDAEMRRHLAERLPPFKVPHPILLVAELPKGPTGKLRRNELARHFGLDRVLPAAAAAEPHTKLQEMLLALWRDVLNRQDVGRDDDFFLLGGDSLAAQDLLHRIEEKLQYRLPLAGLAEAPTVSKLEQYLEKSTSGAVDDTICINGDGRQPPLVAVFGRYGHALRLVPLLRSFGGDQPCYGLQPPGMDWSTAGCTTLPEMAAHYIGRIKARHPSGPYRLLGVSFGALVAFEMALQLQRMGDTVQSLVVVDATPPNCLFEEGAEIAQSLVLEDAHPQTAIEAANQRIAEAHLRARRDYLLDVRLKENLFHGDIAYFYCTGNPVAARRDRRRLWRRLTTARFRLFALPGSHGDVDKEPQFTELQKSLHALYEGRPLPELDPAGVFERLFRIETRGQHESIVDSAGNVCHIQSGPVQGCVVAITMDGEIIRFQGWAVEF